MSDPSAVEPPVSVGRIVRGAPTPEELAAAIVVVGEAYAREAADATAPDAAARSRWELSARGLRVPLNRDAGWNGFTG
ncbi:acyl-CoA carboxylase subunit epsilon [Microbacterium sp. RURRCA19A]|uniref:acyl-CoA carboxylase subunit epsilon n=1 Tax=Microbacterium sp. RURRCA19A TaxID=1907391 RepID=UPI000954C264|nr:acyl-CoA carboxylase subunit epsilon [Microbacterium sp. RURRCA19A]SIR72102.1 Acyl-CoA carboxylase epsilon subunit [Microbacterium sp. RURRCA19A]